MCPIFISSSSLSPNELSPNLQPDHGVVQKIKSHIRFPPLRRFKIQTQKPTSNLHSKNQPPHHFTTTATTTATAITHFKPPTNPHFQKPISPIQPKTAKSTQPVSLLHSKILLRDPPTGPSIPAETKMVQKPTNGDHGGVVNLRGGNHGLFRELGNGAVHEEEAFCIVVEKHGEANRGGAVPANKAGVQGEDPTRNPPGKHSGQSGGQGHHRGGVQRLKREHTWRDFGYATTDGSGAAVRDGKSGLGTLVAMGDDVEWQWRGEEDDYVDETWVEETRRRGKRKGREADTGHLEGLKWEVLVVDEPVVNAFCLPGGKIVVFTGLLEHFRTDPEIATVLGHEVGHVVARHAAEQITKNLWLVILQLILFQFLMPDLVYAMSTVLLRLPFSRRMEMEADYIGLLLMASAGYDPRIAPKVYEKLGQLTGDSPLRDYLSTHPSGKKRAQHLAQAQVMREALALYREAIAGQWVRGFLHE